MKLKSRSLLLMLLSAFFFISCSSTQKRPLEIVVDKNAALAQLEMANTAINKNDFSNATIFLEESWRLAVATDDPEIRIKVLLTKGNSLFNQGEIEQAQVCWKQAEQEAQEENFSILISTSKIYQARGLLSEGLPASEASDSTRQKNAQEAKDIIQVHLSSVRSHALYYAFAWRVLGLAEKELKNFSASEKAFLEAIALHEKNRYLFDIAYDWYLLASTHSKAGNYSGAKQALQNALMFDRKAENSFGLGMDWMALGTIEEKLQDTEAASKAYARAADIFEAAFFNSEALQAKEKVTLLQEK